MILYCFILFHPLGKCIYLSNNKCVQIQNMTSNSIFPFLLCTNCPTSWSKRLAEREAEKWFVAVWTAAKIKRLFHET